MSTFRFASFDFDEIAKKLTKIQDEQIQYLDDTMSSHVGYYPAPPDYDPEVRAIFTSPSQASEFCWICCQRLSLLPRDEAEYAPERNWENMVTAAFWKDAIREPFNPNS